MVEPVTIYISDYTGYNTLRGGAGNDILNGQDGSWEHEGGANKFEGGAGDDTAIGQDGAMYIVLMSEMEMIR